MPKTPSAKLFRLVKSLSGSERRYFKLWVKSAGSDKARKYLQLFDAIVAQDSFDDKALQKKIYSGEKIQSRKYSELKAYLYDTILKALQQYDEKSSIEYRLKGMLLNIKVLFKRSLFAECREQVYKAHKIAASYEAFDAKLELLRWEKELAYAMTDIAFLDEQLDRIWSAEKKILQQQSEVTELRNLFLKLLTELRKDVSRSEQQLSTLKKLARHPLLELEAKVRSHKAKVLRLRFISLYHFSTSEFPAFYSTSRALLDLMETRTEFLKEDVSEYISAINNHLISCGQLAYFDELKKYLKRLKAVEPITGDDRLKIHRQYYMNALRLAVTTGEFEEGVAELENHQHGLQKFDKSAFEKGNFYFLYFYNYFGSGDFEQALHYLNEWLNMPKNIERKDLQALARVLNLIVHYEIGNELLLDSLLRSTVRYLKKEQRIYEFEKHILNFLNRSSSLQSKKDHRQSLIQLKGELDKLRTVASEAQMMKLFDFRAWIESKITGKSFAQVVQENFEAEKSASAFEKS